SKSSSKSKKAASQSQSPASPPPSAPGPSSSLSVKEGDTCPLCGKGVIIRGRTALGCSRWKEGCTFVQKSGQ
ncbi:MAG: hypothetical protein SO142_07305, partial [Prevotella sp.]|nr:hypothetical protein [Prevotella sp.]